LICEIVAHEKKKVIGWRTGDDPGEHWQWGKKHAHGKKESKGVTGGGKTPVS